MTPAVRYRKPTRTDTLRTVEVTGRAGDYWRRADGKSRVLQYALREATAEHVHSVKHGCPPLLLNNGDPFRADMCRCTRDDTPEPAAFVLSRDHWWYIGAGFAVLLFAFIWEITR